MEKIKDFYSLDIDTINESSCLEIIAKIILVISVIAELTCAILAILLFVLFG